MSDSDSDSTYVPSSDEETYKSTLEEIEHMSALITEFTVAIETLESEMAKLNRPLENLYLEQLGTIPFLISSPFRHAEFALKAPGLPGIDITKRYPYHTLCAMLRKYLFATGAVGADGTITLNKQLQDLFGIQESKATFVHLLGALRNVCI
jgi:hypothetical protein